MRDLGFPVNRIVINRFGHMPDGPIVEGLVERIERDGVVYFIIRDGGYWYHPELQAFVGQVMSVQINWPDNRIELKYYGDTRLIRVLTEEVLH